MPTFPPFHTAATDARTNTLRVTSTILIELGNLQHFRSRPRGTHDMIKNHSVRRQRRRTGRGERRTIRRGTGVRSLWSKDQTAGLVELHFTERHESSDRGLKDLGRKRGIPWLISDHQRIKTFPGRHVVCHWQCGCELLLDEKVEDFIRMGSWSTEDALSKQLGRSEFLKSPRVRIADDFK